MAVTSQDAVLLRQLRSDVTAQTFQPGGAIPTQWDDADFVPIRDAIDALFRAEGLIAP